MFKDRLRDEKVKWQSEVGDWIGTDGESSLGVECKVDMQEIDYRQKLVDELQKVDTVWRTRFCEEIEKASREISDEYSVVMSELRQSNH